MKLNVAVNEAVLSNVGTTGEFRIRNSAKAFKILSDGLYSNKIRAIIRELSCNAVDSHIAAGRANVPFEVHLPTILEPWFSVKDFGLGLDGSQVTSIYTTYFESTKTDSNEFIGALGLGSKSPFSYTENFTVIAIKDGFKRIYSAFINEQGIPCVAEMSEELTDEPNGVEVKFSVTDRSDYQSFRNEAIAVFKWFKHKPTITGIADFTIPAVEYREQNVIPGVHVFHGISRATMGNICYPIQVPDAEKHFGKLADLLECCLLIEFEIGELDFAASREELSYVPLTIASIKRKLEELNANLTVYVAKQANEFENLWHRAAYLQENYHSKLYGPAVRQYVANTKFPLFDEKKYHGQKEFFFSTEELSKRGFAITAFRMAHGSATRVSESTQYGVGSTYVKGWNISVSNDVVFVLNDLKTGCNARARYHFSRLSQRCTVYCISHSSDVFSLRQDSYDVLMKELYNPPTILKASELDKRPTPVRTSVSQGIMILSEDRSGGLTWAPYKEELDEDETYTFVYMSGYDILTKEGKAFDAHSLRRLLTASGIPALQKIKIFGVRKSRVKEINELDNWIWVEDKVKEVVATIGDAEVASLVAAECLDDYYNKVYTSKYVARLVGPDSYYAQYVTKVEAIPRMNGNVNDLSALCKVYGKTVQFEKVKDDLNSAKALLIQKYPMIKYLRHSNPAEQDVAEYIKMVDSQEKK